MRKLEQGVSERINSICDHAKRLVDGGDVKFAVNKYIEALNLIPNPKMDYKAATFIYTNVGEVYFRSGDFKNAGTAFSQASVCPGGSDNPIIIMRIGQCLLECGDKNRAEDYLYKAYLKGGEDIFASEDQKYIHLIARRLNNSSDPEPVEEISSAEPAEEYDDFSIDLQKRDEDYITLPLDDYDEPEPEPEPEPHEPAEQRRRFSPRNSWQSEWEDEPSDNYEDDRIKSSYADDLDDDDADEEYDEDGGLFSPLINAVKSWFRK